MAKINLLPWREELRKQQMQEFLVILGMVVFAAAVVAFAWKREREMAVENQTNRNAYVEQQIALMDENIKEIDELQKRRDALIERMTVIQGLQGNRPVIVHVFDQFAETLPDGVYYTSIKQTGARYDIAGVAESNNRVSNLMRSLEQSPWFTKPQLNKVVAKGDTFEFDLSVQLDPTAIDPAKSQSAAAGAQPAPAK
ncbi:MAG: PilN domain-containing protein [Pseudomonadota bacterium]